MVFKAGEYGLQRSDTGIWLFHVNNSKYMVKTIKGINLKNY